MNWFHSVLLGIVEGVTEFLPISSTGHVTLVSKLLGYEINDPGLTAYTAVIQTGAMIAAIVYFRSDIVRIIAAWFRGLGNAEARRDPNYRLGWAVIVGTAVTGAIGYLGKDLITGPLRSMWFVAGGLILWSIVMFIADRVGKQHRGETSITWKDGLVLGLAQCIALIPGVSRSGATISTGLLSGIDRVTATRLSFFLGIPALIAAGGYEVIQEAPHISSTVGWLPTGIGIVVSFIVGYLSIAWLLRFVSKHNFNAFVIYRVVVGLIIIGLLLSGAITAT